MQQHLVTKISFNLNSRYIIQVLNYFPMTLYLLKLYFNIETKFITVKVPENQFNKCFYNKSCR